jgi:hypothetical protein
MSESNRAAPSGIGFLGLLTILLIGLKLTHAITWSWWLVLLPFYGPPLVLLFLAVMAIIAFKATGEIK